MIPRLTTEQVAVAASRHVVTIRLALVSGELHGTQHVKGGRWLVREDCFEAWLDGEKCEHQRGNVTPIRRADR